MAPKENIPLDVKRMVWTRDCHVSDPRIAQCKTCYCIVKIPQSLLHIVSDNSIIPYECNGVGEFGHIISEKKGGLPSTDNLIIQCKSCNTSLGTKQAVFDKTTYDQFMIPSELLENNSNNHNHMNVDCERCCHILKNNSFCKNKPLFNRSFCHIHLNF